MSPCTILLLLTGSKATKTIHGLTFASDGSVLISGSAAGTVLVWEVEK